MNLVCILQSFRKLDAHLFDVILIKAAPVFQNLETLDVLIVLVIAQRIFPVLAIEVLAHLDTHIDGVRTEVWTLLEITELAAVEPVTLEDVVCVVHVCCVWVRVEVPDRYVADLRYELEVRIVLAVVIPVGIFLLDSKRTFHNPCAEESHLKCGATKMLACAALFELVLDLLLHLLRGKHGRIERGRRRSSTCAFLYPLNLAQRVTERP